MIAPDYRVTDPQQKFAENAAKYIKFTYGKSLTHPQLLHLSQSLMCVASIILNTNILRVTLKNIGDTMWNDLETDIQGVETLHN